MSGAAGDGEDLPLSTARGSDFLSKTHSGGARAHFGPAATPVLAALLVARPPAAEGPLSASPACFGPLSPLLRLRAVRAEARARRGCGALPVRRSAANVTFAWTTTLLRARQAAPDAPDAAAIPTARPAGRRVMSSATRPPRPQLRAEDEERVRS